MVRIERILFMLIVVLASGSVDGQTIPADRTAEWSQAGFIYDIPEPTLELNILDFGAMADGSISTNTAWNAAIATAEGQMTVIAFPEGEFLFTTGIIVPDSVIIRGAGSDLTTFTFDLGGIGHCISFMGEEIPDQFPLAADAPRGSTAINPAASYPFGNGDLLRLYREDLDLVTSPWAVGTTGQLVHIAAAGDATIMLASPLRADYEASSSYVTRIEPCWFSGIECVRIKRLDPTEGQWSNILLNMASHCRVRGVESDNANFAHIEVYESTNCEITGNYLHHAFSYGSGGKAYGVNMTNTSGEVLVENNIFEHLRHSMIVQIGSNGNVLAYNYSVDPYWEQPSLPSNSAGDLVLHGDHPYLNLFEGNIVQNIVIDDSHGINGPYNTFFRNRAGSYGLVMSNAPPTDSLNLAGNEVAGFFVVQGEGHFMHGNLYLGGVIPPGTEILADTTYYLQQFPAFLSPVGDLPQIGPQAAAPGTIPAKLRYENGSGFTVCSGDDISTSIADPSAMPRIYPDPFTDRIMIEGIDVQRIILRDVIGRVIIDRKITTNGSVEELRSLIPATYLLEVTDRQGRSWRWKVVKE